MEGLTILGKKVTEPQDSIETFPSPGRSLERVALDCIEFTSLCPVTGQPDYGRVWISYWPHERCAESKSLKLYLLRYRAEGVFAEALAVQILDDFMRDVKPYSASVHVKMNARGGIGIEAKASSIGGKEDD